MSLLTCAGVFSSTRWWSTKFPSLHTIQVELSLGGIQKIAGDLHLICLEGPMNPSEYYNLCLTSRPTVWCNRYAWLPLSPVWKQDSHYSGLRRSSMSQRIASTGNNTSVTTLTFLSIETYASALKLKSYVSSDWQIRCVKSIVSYRRSTPYTRIWLHHSNRAAWSKSYVANIQVPADISLPAVE